MLSRGRQGGHPAAHTRSLFFFVVALPLLPPPTFGGVFLVARALVFLLLCVMPLSLPVLVEGVPLDPLTDEAKVSLERFVLLPSPPPSPTLPVVELLPEPPVSSVLFLLPLMSMFDVLKAAADGEEDDIDVAVVAVTDDLAEERVFLVGVLSSEASVSSIFCCPFLFQRASRPRRLRRWLGTPPLDSCSKSGLLVLSLPVVGALLTSRVSIVYVDMVLGIDGDESSTVGAR